MVDEPTSLPDGTEFELVALDEGMTPEERAELEVMIEESERELDAGLGMSVEQFWAEFRANRR